MMRPKGPFCQSCGMPLERDEKGGGTEADGSKSELYCSHCYEAGQFTAPDLTVDQMKDQVRARLKERGVPFLLVGPLVGKIPDLKRWRSA